MSGRVVHFEVPFDDGDRARSFYKEAFGWQIMEMPEMGYTIVMTGPSDDSGPTEPGFINGGMLSREQGGDHRAGRRHRRRRASRPRWRRSAAWAAPPSSGRRRSATWASPPTSRTPRATSIGLWETARPRLTPSWLTRGSWLTSTVSQDPAIR